MAGAGPGNTEEAISREAWAFRTTAAQATRVVPGAAVVQIRSAAMALSEALTRIDTAAKAATVRTIRRPSRDSGGVARVLESVSSERAVC